MEKNKILEQIKNMQLTYYAKAAEKLGIEWKILIPSLLMEFSKGDKSWRQMKSISPLNDSVAAHLTMYKNTCNKYLKKEGFNAPSYKIVKTLEDVKLFIEENKTDKIVTKPTRGFGGAGISILPENEKEILDALELAKDKSMDHSNPKVMVEEFIPGLNYRLLVLGDKVIAAVLREPAKVTGDGKQSIQLLIDSKNTTLKEQNKEEVQMDIETEKILKSKNMTLDSIPKEGEVIYLRINCNMCSGGTTAECLNRVNKYYKDIAVKATIAVGLRLSGVDLITTDITNPNAGYAINEINHNPGLRIHYLPDKGEPFEAALPIQKYILNNL